MSWFSMTKDEVKNSLHTDLSRGISLDSVDERLEKYGHNLLEAEKKKSLLQKLKEQFSDFLILILIGAAIISIFIGEKTDAIVIMAIVIINAFLGIFQEGKAEKALEALNKMASPNAKVIRSGNMEIIPAENLLPGDLVILDAGDIIPADLRLVESSNLRIEEASLTGESIPVEKDADAVLGEKMDLGDRINMAYMSTSVAYGHGNGIVVDTGHNTEIGKIATMIQSYETELTPLQKQLNKLGKVLGFTTIVICMIVFILGISQGRELLDMFMIAVSLAVAAIPEGLPAIVTIVLALGMNRMVKRHAIVKKLLAVETLGSTTVICSDKTGTLTQNEMTVVSLYVDDTEYKVEGIGYEPKGQFIAEDGAEIIVEEFDGAKIDNFKNLLIMATLANDANLSKNDEGYFIIGDPTEGALITLGAKAKLEKDALNALYPRVADIPFDSDRKMMSSFHSNYIDDKIVSFTKGAPDVILDKCNRIKLGDEIKPLSDEDRIRIENKNLSFSRKAIRVLAVAYKDYDKLDAEINSETNERDMIFVGLIGMIDPARVEAKAAIAECKTAGIKTIMITGDYKETAFAIAKELNMADSIDEAMMGRELDNISDEELREVVKKVKVYARVSPQHKVRIVDALRANGEIVAMTGDGVNDALALKRADIGVAMGITGTDVAKNTADMILTDDNFASIVSAVEEGRIIYSNIKKFVLFLLSCNIGEILLVFVSILLGMPVPLVAIQLLWLNLVTDSFPALALGMEKGDKDIMEEKPRDSNEAILDRESIMVIITQSVMIAGVSLLAYYWGFKYCGYDLDKSRALTFVTLITAELLRAYSVRSQRHSLFEIGFFTNKTMVMASCFSFFLLLIVIYIPQLQPVFRTFSLGVYDWSIVFRFALIPLIVGEAQKIIKLKLKRSKNA